MLSAIRIPGLFVVGTDTEIGKTVVAGGIADWFRRRSYRTAVLKPVATGCVHRREGLVSEDAEFLAACSDTRWPLDLICPQRYVEPLAPAVAAERAGRPIEWDAVERSVRLMTAESDVLLIEGVGGVMVPLDPDQTVLDLVSQWKLPVVVVARPNLGTINHTLLTLKALRSVGARVAGVVINRYRLDNASVAEETNGRAIERWGKAPLLATVPAVQEPLLAEIATRGVPPDIAAALEPVDWARLANA